MQDLPSFADPTSHSSHLTGLSHYTTRLYLPHQPRLIPPTKRGGTTFEIAFAGTQCRPISRRPPDEGDAGRSSISTRKAFLLLPRGIRFQLTCFTPCRVDETPPQGGTCERGGTRPDNIWGEQCCVEARLALPFALRLGAPLSHRVAANVHPTR